MVHMKVTASILLAVAAIAPVVANGLEAENSLITREDNEFESSFARDFDLDLEEREFDDDIFERELGAVVTPQTREFDDDVLEREFEEDLYERGRGAAGALGKAAMGIMKSGGGKGLKMKAGGGKGKAMKGMMKAGRGGKGKMSMKKTGGGRKGRMMKTGGGKGTMKALGKGGKAIGRVASEATSTPAPEYPESPSEAREFDDELFERELDELLERELDEHFEREFEEELFGRAPGGGGGKGGGDKREFDDELFSRDADLELFEREPEPFLFFNHIKKWWKNRKGKKTDAADEDAPAETRSFDEMELLN